MNIRLNKLEPDLDREFERFYKSNIISTANGKTMVNLKLAFSTEFKEKSYDFFSKYKDQYSKIDEYFNNFHDMWRFYLDMDQFQAAERLWDDVLDIVSDWETDEQKIHKGTPFYWLAGTAILNGEFEKGFALMHQALEEDMRTHNTPTPKSPAFFFVALNYDETLHYFRQMVRQASNFLEDKINNYVAYMRNYGGSSLSLPNFKLGFLEQTNILDVVFYFVYALFKARHMLLDVKREWRQNALCSLLETGLIFDLCLIIEETIKEKDDTRYSSNRIYFSNRISFLSQTTGLTIHQNLRTISADCRSDFAGTLGRLLDSTYNLANGIEEDLSIVLAFRNFAAHSIESIELVYENFEKIFQRVLNALFFSVEKLY